MQIVRCCEGVGACLDKYARAWLIIVGRMLPTIQVDAFGECSVFVCTSDVGCHIDFRVKLGIIDGQFSGIDTDYRTYGDVRHGDVRHAIASSHHPTSVFRVGLELLTELAVHLLNLVQI